jgi:glycerol-3-phosphate dehydrogenase (NAD(P)+)
MNVKEYWKRSTVAVVGGGAWGTVLAHLASQNAQEVRVWVRQEETVKAINVDRENIRSVPGLILNERVKAFPTLDRVFEVPVQAIIWALPSQACRGEARQLAHRIRGDEIILHATKGIEASTFKRISEVLLEEWPTGRVGVLSGPNLAHEVAKGDPGATVVASRYEEVIQSGVALFSNPQFSVLRETDVVGIEWAGVLKNIYAIGAGAMDTLGYGWNARAWYLSRALDEMILFTRAMGAHESTLRGLAGMGDLLATCGSPQSRNYRVGAGRARGEPLEMIIEKLGAVAEGVSTAGRVFERSQTLKIPMPMAGLVLKLLEEQIDPQVWVQVLLGRQ